MSSFLTNLKKTYLAPRVLGIGFFAFPYGMMFFLAVTTLQVWLKDLGISNSTIGLYALVSLPYVFKFLWAPMVDQINIPFLTRKLGHRRSWLLTIHMALIVGLLLLAHSRPQENLVYTGAIAVFLAFCAATQDIIVDAYRIEILKKEELVPGVSILIFGYRLGSITAKAGALYLANNYNWTVAYVVMAMLIFIGVFATLFNPEPLRPSNKQSGILYQKILRPFREFQKRSPYLWAVILFVVLYRFGDAMINNMANVFYLEIGFDKTEIARVGNVFGICATILGGFLGGGVVKKMRLYPSLLMCGVLHTLSNLMFLVMVKVGYNLNALYMAIGLENITGGMSTAAFFVYLSRLCNPKYTATQFALLTSVWSLATPFASLSGVIQEQVLRGNWEHFFILTVFVSIPGLILIKYLKKFPFGNDGGRGARIS